MKTKQSKILVIDDSQFNIELLVALLEEEYRMITADCGQQGIEKAVSEAPDLILLDVSMPIMDGYMVCEQLKIDPQTRNIPVIFVTAMDEMEDEARGLELGAIDYITKPFSPQIIRARVNNHLELKLARDRLMQLSMVDGLTGIANRRQFDRVIKQEWQRGIRKQTPLSLLLLDIDFFKQYNDRYGHLKGDDCLKQIANAFVGQVMRPMDLVARYGGEEFVCVLPDTEIEGATYLAQRIIEQMAKLKLEHQGSCISDHVTVSIGISTVQPCLDLHLPDFIDCADKALYQAKQNGRNRYEVRSL